MVKVNDAKFSNNSENMIILNFDFTFSIWGKREEMSKSKYFCQAL